MIAACRCVSVAPQPPCPQPSPSHSAPAAQRKNEKKKERKERRGKMKSIALFNIHLFPLFSNPIALSFYFPLCLSLSLAVARALFQLTPSFFCGGLHYYCVPRCAHPRLRPSTPVPPKIRHPRPPLPSPAPPRAPPAVSLALSLLSATTLSGPALLRIHIEHISLGRPHLARARSLPRHPPPPPAAISLALFLLGRRSPHRATLPPKKKWGDERGEEEEVHSGRAVPCRAAGPRHPFIPKTTLKSCARHLGPSTIQRGTEKTERAARDMRVEPCVAPRGSAELCVQLRQKIMQARTRNNQPAQGEQCLSWRRGVDSP